MSKLGYDLLRNDGGAWGSDPQDEDDEACLVLRSTEIESDGSWNIKDPAYRVLNEKEFKKTVLLAGDILVTKSSGSEHHIGKSALVGLDIASRRASFSNFMQRLSPDSTVDSKYLHYFMNGECARSQYNYARQSSIGLGNLSSTILNDLGTPVPPLPEQISIARYLDTKTAQIDALIAAKQQQACLLEEQRTALIHRAVTRGLDPDAELKDSGVAWLGQMPVGWGVTKLSRITELTNGYAFPSSSFADEGIPVVRIGDFKDYGVVDTDNAKLIPKYQLCDYGSYMLEKEDIVIAMTGATVGKVAKFISKEPALLNQRVCAIRPSSSILQRFLWFNLHSYAYKQYVELTAFGGAQPNISDTQLTDWYIALPPIDIQHSILDELASRSKSITSSIQALGKEVTTLQSLRTSLISEVVTGKRDVRAHPLAL